MCVAGSKFEKESARETVRMRVSENEIKRNHGTETERVGARAREIRGYAAT